MYHFQKMKSALKEISTFVQKQIYACTYGIALLALILITHWWYPLEGIYRYDFLFLCALALKIILLVCHQESKSEFVMILLFHFSGILMEVFKTSPEIGSWTYPEPFMIGIAGAPFFAGFMYNAVGSYIARSWELFYLRFKNYPPIWMTVITVIAIYINFFTHHFWYDVRYIILFIIFLLYGQTVIYYRIREKDRKMPMLVFFSGITLLIWLAENLGTFGNVWLYPNQQEHWELVSPEKILSWFLLMLLCFILVSLVHPLKQFKAVEPKSKSHQ